MVEDATVQHVGSLNTDRARRDELRPIVSILATGLLAGFVASTGGAVRAHAPQPHAQGAGAGSDASPPAPARADSKETGGCQTPSDATQRPPSPAPAAGTAPAAPTGEEASPPKAQPEGLSRALESPPGGLHKRVVVAVFPVPPPKGLNLDDAVRAALRSEVELALAKTGQYDVTADDAVDALLRKARRKSHEPRYEASSRAALGRQLAANRVATIEITRVGPRQCRLNLRLYDVDRGILRNGGRADGRCDPMSLLYLADAVVAQLLNAVSAGTVRALPSVLPPPAVQDTAVAPSSLPVAPPAKSAPSPSAGRTTASPAQAEASVTEPAPRDAGASPNADSTTSARPTPASVVKSCPAGFVFVPPGVFVMGSPEDEPGHDDDEAPQHRVRITHAFCLGHTEVTLAKWKRHMDTRHLHFPNCGDSCPVAYVTWWDALAFANEVSRAAGLRPCYRLEGCRGHPGDGLRCKRVEVLAPDRDVYRCEGYRLPTEAEWEYAYRAGTTTALYSGPVTRPRGRDPNADAIAWYRANSDGHPHPVASKAPNAWGLYDMAGNVWEWCWDRYQAGYRGGHTVENPSGPAEGVYRVQRGGGWNSDPAYLRAAYRNYEPPETRQDTVGFRLARTARP